MAVPSAAVLPAGACRPLGGRCTWQDVGGQGHRHHRPAADPTQPPLTRASSPCPLRSAKKPAIAEGDESMEFETSKGVKVVSSFDAMGLREDLLRGIYQFGFEKPSAIQQRAVLPITQGRDVIAQAQSGTGKTSLIAITLCQMLDTTLRE